MTDDERRLLANLTDCIEAVAEGRPAVPMPEASIGDPALDGLARAVRHLLSNFEALRLFSISLANGRIDAEAPPKLHLLDPLKSLQASLKHLTWQTQEVAAGNLDHRVDFLGEFSTAFNQMVTALKDKRRAEHEAMQAARLASIGQLAAGIAHEINTPAQYVGDNLRYVEDVLPPLLDAVRGIAPLPAGEADLLAEDLPAAIKEALEGVARISKIVQSMKEFSLPGTTEMTTTDLNKALESTLTVCQNELKTAAQVEKRFDPDLPCVVCHASEVNQVFLNLILNAAQAIQSSGKPLPGRILVETLREAGFAVVRVSDSGAGVPMALRERIFDPFFTTKPVGQGTGQGLAICRDVIEVKHKGGIEVGGSEGEGAVFTVRLPIGGA
ncbi:MAG: hypothetical protein EPN26_15250 [Rhodospirillales bacterium]|nr:MAG: hypothetical protein EPN26_15250 [Rhodospirillales bacterium]